ncbi:MAG: hypothetical protein ACE5D6_05715, partial [Candidatus Zixiibacteriota bacterium]
AVYQDFVDSVQRSMSVLILVDKRKKDFIDFYKTMGIDTFVTYIQDFGPAIGLTKDAEIVVTDKFYIRTLRTKNNVTTEYKYLRTLIRYGYFIKRGDDSRPFSGWQLYAYSGGGALTPTKVQIVREDNSVFRGDSLQYTTFSSLLIDRTTSAWDTVEVVSTEQLYIKLIGTDAIASTNQGETLQINVVETSAFSIFQTITAETTNGFILQNMLPNNSFKYSAVINTPSNNNHLWNLIYFQEFRKTQTDTASIPIINTLIFKGWCVPYNVGN